VGRGLVIQIAPQVRILVAIEGKQIKMFRAGLKARYFLGLRSSAISDSPVDINWGHSPRSACIGSTRAARSAGMQHAASITKTIRTEIAPEFTKP
jgi:hypothetical protein